MDRRITPFSGRIAHDSLRGRIEAAAFTPGEVMEVAVPVADLRAAPAGQRERQLILGEAVTVIDRREGHAFVMAAKDGYCGWLAETATGPASQPSHWLAAPGSHLYTEPRIQAPEIAAITLGSRLRVLSQEGRFLRTPHGFVPAMHLRPLTERADDPATVAEGFLGTPYLWGGNSRAGIDCSGLVQAALTACGIACPGDSDLQQQLGAEIGQGHALQRGDLLFWAGHVAMVVDPDRLIHANGHRMAVTHEGIAACIARIAAEENRPVIARRRPRG